MFCSMPGPEVVIAGEEEPQNYGEEYDLIMKERQDLTEMKRFPSLLSKSNLLSPFYLLCLSSLFSFFFLMFVPDA